MALIRCTECEKEYSDKAPACPQCGCPTRYNLVPKPPKTESVSNQEELPQEQPKPKPDPMESEQGKEEGAPSSSEPKKVEREKKQPSIPITLQKPRKPSIWMPIFILMVAIGCIALAICFAVTGVQGAGASVPGLIGLAIFLAVMTGFFYWKRKKRYQQLWVEYTAAMRTIQKEWEKQETEQQEKE